MVHNLSRAFPQKGPVPQAQAEGSLGRAFLQVKGKDPVGGGGKNIVIIGGHKGGMNRKALGEKKNGNHKNGGENG